MMIMLAIVPVRLRAIASIRSPLGSHWALYNAGGAEKATDPASSDVIASPAPLSSRPFLDLDSCQEAQPRHLHGDTRHCMPGGSASAFACQEAQPRHLHGETAIDDTSLVSFSSSLACPRGNRISGVNSSVDYPDEVRPLNLLAP